ncbi:MAG: hypothetical protein R3315_05000, partial [Woeseiaceae bacterium]|nr:hypothetical protein [Woeseiaceae bacterium]
MADIKRIAMWSGPRNISTALMRAWENRPDCVVVDEPFYAHYLHATGIDHPGREQVLRSQPLDWRIVVNELRAPLPDGCSIHYQKHMAHHLLSGMEGDWLDDLTHAFLIRDPQAMVASYARSRDAVTAADLGLHRQVAIWKRVRERSGREPPVVDSRDVLEQPERMLQRLCSALGVGFDDAMLSWPAGPRESDGAWAPYWYASVQASTGFRPFAERAFDLPED